MSEAVLSNLDMLGYLPAGTQNKTGGWWGTRRREYSQDPTCHVYDLRDREAQGDFRCPVCKVQEPQELLSTARLLKIDSTSARSFTDETQKC